MHDELSGREMYAIVRLFLINKKKDCANEDVFVRSIAKVMKSLKWPQTIPQQKSLSSKP